MGFFKKFKRKAEEKSEKNILLAMPMFSNNESHDIQKVVEHLKSFWDLDVQGYEDASNEAAVFDVNGQRVAIAYMPGLIPSEEIESVIPFNYQWKEAANDLKGQTGHTIVSVLTQGELDDLQRHIILSKILCSILMTSNCIGIYQGMTSQLFPKEYYLDFVEDLKNDELATPLWIYIGIRNTEDGGDIYTYGLTNFGKLELEIINTHQDIGDMWDFIIDIAGYVIANDVTFRDGETLGYTEDQKVPITITKGVYVDNMSIKLGI